MITEVIEQEREDLPTHVSLCSQRYKELHDRMTSVERKVDAVINTVETVKKEMKSDLFKAVSAIIVALIGSVGTIVAVMLNAPK